MRSILILFWLLVINLAAQSQNGEIAGKVIDEKGEGIPYANVLIVDNKGVSVGRGAATDFDGNYSLKPLTPGKYNVQYSYIGYGSQVQPGVVVNADKATLIDIKLKLRNNSLDDTVIITGFSPSTAGSFGPDDEGRGINIKSRPNSRGEVEVIVPRTRLESTVVPAPHKFILSVEQNKRENYILKIRTEKESAEWNWIEAACKKEGSNIIITIGNLLTGSTRSHPINPNAKTTMRYGHAEENIGDLPIGNYMVRVIYYGDTIPGSINIKDADGTISLTENDFVSIAGDGKFVRVPGNTLWGFVLYDSKKDSNIRKAYLRLLKKNGGSSKKLAPGNYYAFKVDTNSKFAIHSNSHGWVCEDAFIFHYTKSFEELKELTRNFIDKKGGDNVDVILYNDKGEWFSEVR